MRQTSRNKRPTGGLKSLRQISRRWLYLGLAIVTAWFCIELERPPAFGALSSSLEVNIPSDRTLSGSTLTLPYPKTSLRSSLTLNDLSSVDQDDRIISKLNTQNSTLNTQNSPCPQTPVPCSLATIQQTLRQGQDLYQSGRFAEALTTWESTLPQLETDPPRQSITLTLMALAQIELGQWPSAQTSLDRSQSLWPQIQDVRTQHFVQGKFWATQGRLWLAEGKLVDSYQAYQSAELAYAQAEDTWGNLQSRLNQIKVLRLQGFGTQAFRNIERWLPEVKALPDNALKVMALRQVAEAWAILGDRDQANAFGTQSLDLAQSLSLPSEIIESALSLGHLNWDNPLQAFNYFNQALAAATEFPEQQIQAQVNLLRIGLRFPRSESQLLTFYTDLQNNLQKVPLTRSRVFARLNLAETLLQYPEWTDTFAIDEQDFQTLLHEALQDSQTLQDGRLEAYALGVLGSFEEREDRFKSAEAYTKQALLAAQHLNDPVGLYQWQWQLGRVLMAQEQFDSARETYAQTLETLQGLRTDLANLSTDLNFSFEEKIDPVYRQYVQLLLTPDPGSLLSQERLQAARNTIESLQVQELVSFFKANCVSAKTIDIDTLDASAAVIYPILLRDSLEIIVGFPGEPLRHYQSAVTRGTLERAAQLLRSALAESSSPQRWRRSAQTQSGTASSQALRLVRYMYDALIAPMAADLKAATTVKTLVFTLDGALRNIPMGVLFDGSHYLIEDYAIAVSPGLQLLETKPIDLTNLEVLIGGVTEGGEVSVTGTGQRSQLFSPLPFVKNEVYGIQQSLKSVLLLNDGQTLAVNQGRDGEADRGEGIGGNAGTTATDTAAANAPKLFPKGAFEPNNIVKELSTGKFSIVHFATHGQFTSRADETFILAWNETLTLDELKGLLQPIDRSNAQPLELLVLSACQTALGDDRAALGLAGMAVRSGARSTLATLWSVDDQGTAELMQAFYHNLVQEKLPRAEALRQAQLSLLNGTDHSTPYFWAPFILVGSWL